MTNDEKKSLLYVACFVIAVLIIHTAAGDKPTQSFLLLVIAGIILYNSKTIIAFSNNITSA